MEARRTIRVGHRGADAISPGNTVESFLEAVRVGVEVIELDVVWEPLGADAELAEDRPPLMVAHDLGDLAARPHPSFAEALDAFTRPPLDEVEIDVDIKIAGREEEIVAAIREAGLADRAMFSGMEIESIERLAEIAPEMRRGWTLPRLTSDPRRSRLKRRFIRAGMVVLRRRLPRIVRRRATELGVWSVWVLYPLITPELVRAAHDEGLAVFAWTVDSAARQAELVRLGVDGVVTNDPRLFESSLGAATERARG